MTLLVKKIPHFKKNYIGGNFKGSYSSTLLIGILTMELFSQEFWPILKG
jgi:hypothetical protein